MAGKHSGRCSCGTVTFEFEYTPTFVAVCHCRDCKDASSGEATTFFAVPEENFRLLSGDPEAVPYIAQSGKKLERLFCPNCGSPVYTANLESFPGTIFVNLAGVDDPSGIEPKVEMFTKCRLEGVKPLDLPQFTDMPN